MSFEIGDKVFDEHFAERVAFAALRLRKTLLKMSGVDTNGASRLRPVEAADTFTVRTFDDEATRYTGESVLVATSSNPAIMDELIGLFEIILYFPEKRSAL